MVDNAHRFVRKEAKEVSPTEDIGLVRSAMRLMAALLAEDFGPTVNPNDKAPEKEKPASGLVPATSIGGGEGAGGEADGAAEGGVVADGGADGLLGGAREDAHSHPGAARIARRLP